VISNGRVVDPSPHLAEDEADGESDCDAAGDVEQKAAGGAGEREAAGDDGGDGDPVGDEGGAVVDEALALDEGDQPAREAEPLGDRARGSRVGGRDDGAEHEGGRPGEPGDGGVRDGGDREHRREDQPDRKERDLAHVRAELP